MTERDRCISNLYALSKRKGIRIRDLETTCGVSVGYLARLRQDKRQPFPGSEFLFRAAARLETSLDSLLYFDFQLSTETDQYLHAFVNRLILDTLKEKLRWNPDPVCIPDPETFETVAPPDHPLVSLDPALLQEGKTKPYYYSPFHPSVYNLVPCAAWRTNLTEDTVVFLTVVSNENQQDASAVSVRETELYLYNTEAKALSPLCFSDTNHPGMLDHDLSVLCEMVAESLQRTSLDRFAVSAIDAYLKGDTLG